MTSEKSYVNSGIGITSLCPQEKDAGQKKVLVKKGKELFLQCVHATNICRMAICGRHSAGNTGWGTLML